MKSLKVLLGAMTLFVFSLTAITAADVKPVQEAEEVVQTQITQLQKEGVNPVFPTRSASPLAFQLNWLSVNGGGAINASSTTYQLGLSVGQSVAGFASSPSYQMGIGFWYGAATGTPVCAATKGDLNGSGGLSAADVSLMLNCVFLNSGAGTAGGDCNPCYADANCSGGLSPADVSIELLAVFLFTPFPC